MKLTFGNIKNLLSRHNLTEAFELSVVCLVCIILLVIGIGIVRIFQTEYVELKTSDNDIELQITTNLGPDWGPVQIKPLLNLSEYNAKIVGDLDVDKLTLGKIVKFLTEGMAEDITVNFKAKKVIVVPKEVNPAKTTVTK